MPLPQLPPSPVPAPQPPSTLWKRPFEEGLAMLEAELQDKLEKRRRLDEEIAAIDERVKMAKILDDC
ncbi:hypothetical protein DFQ28_002180 [Apophysomyces sp. BC1034]|nr:hypothetical protein DFQ30_008908 [Apophysomyces sp. BC1015]KAG0173826.1 hypothetical protein DFQ29_007747 [Apophysomyces sp. BC1021]KAG0190365.1 hypothetical protein DFQ28_002180 [Apophysomyces sp. BC1034]